MDNTELKNIISEYDAGKVFARNKAEDTHGNNDKQDAEIWELIEVSYTDLIYKLHKFLK